MGSGGSSGRLRGELTEFVGRRAELALVRQALGEARLVTLTGPGGIGKTRLALQAAGHARRAFRDGAWLAQTAPATKAPARSLGVLMGVKPAPLDFMALTPCSLWACPAKDRSPTACLQRPRGDIEERLAGDMRRELRS
jgi:hypothetical protein